MLNFKIRYFLAALGLAGLFALASAAPVFAVDPLDEACDRVNQQSTVCASDNTSLTGSDGLIARITNVVAVVAGILAVIMMIWGGFTYITSGGDTGKTTSARNTIIYAAVGLLVIVLAQSIIVFILNRLG